MNLLEFCIWSDADTKKRTAEETIEELQERIDKAIEYIEDCTKYDIDDNTCEDVEKDRLLKILKGSDKE